MLRPTKSKISLKIGLPGIAELGIEGEWQQDLAAATKSDVIKSNMLVPVYQFHAVNHFGGWRFFYSLSNESFKDWLFDGIAFYAYANLSHKTVPIYQLHAINQIGEVRYHYVKDGNYGEGWVLDNIAFYAYKEKENNTMPIYQYHAENHEGGWRFNYTTNPNLEDGWQFDGTAFYAVSV